MARNPKTFDQALADAARVLWADTGAEADLVEGSVTRSLLEAVAFNVADLSDRQERSIEAAVPEAIYRAFGFGRGAASAARGAVTFLAPGGAPFGVVIPLGTEVLTDAGVGYVTTEDATLPSGSSEVTVPVAAREGGARGNAAIGAVSRVAFAPLGVSGVTNRAPITGGADSESPEDQAARFARHLATLDQSTRGGLTEALAELNVAGERFDSVLVTDGDDDPAIEPGRVLVHVYKKGGASNALMTAARSVIAARRAAGALVVLIPTVATPVVVQATLTTRAFGVSGAARAALDAYFANLKFGEKISFENIIVALKNASADIVEVTLGTPGTDVPAGRYGRFELGAATLTEST